MKRIIFTITFTIMALLSLSAFVTFGVKRYSTEAAANGTNSTDQQQDQTNSENALLQMRALNAEKMSRTAAQQKLDSQLLYLMKQQRGEWLAPALSKLETNINIADTGLITVEITGQVNGKLLEQLAIRNAEVLSSFPNFHSLTARVSLTELEAIAALPEVVFIQPEQRALIPAPLTDEGSVNAIHYAENASLENQTPVQRLANQLKLSASNVPSSGALFEGDVTHRANETRRTFGINGSGVKIGVLSDGVSNLRISQAMGHLGNVTVLPGQSGSGDEGTALLEIIHQLAPGAQLYFATAGGGIPNFSKNIKALRALGCDILTDDVYYATGSPFNDGQLPNVLSPTNAALHTQAINDVTADGAMYIGGAGNWGNKNDGLTGTWEGDFNDGGATTGPLVGLGRVHDFGNGKLFNTIAERVEPSFMTLQWADPLGGSSNDYDLFVLDATGTTVVAASTNVQNGSQDPYEVVGPQALGRRVVIVKRNGADRFLHLALTRSRFSISTEGGIRGQHIAAACIDVAAAPANTAFPNIANSPTGPYPNAYSNASQVERLSADGPRRMFFKADGSPFTPDNFTSTGGIVRQKPELTAADGVLCSGAGGFILFPPLNLHRSPFFGTSAASPHLAGILALLKSANPTFTNDQLREALFNSAIDIEAPGVDRDSGHGIAMAYEAAQYLGLKSAADLEVGDVLATELRGNGNGAVEPGEVGELVVELKNFGSVNATDIRAVLVSTTPWVQIWQPSEAKYGDLPAQTDVAANGQRFTFYVHSAAPSDVTGLLALRVNADNNANTKMLPFNVSFGTLPTMITAALDDVATADGSSYTATTGFQTGRLVPTNTPSVCGKQKATPALIATGARRYDAYTFQTVERSAPTCATVYLQRTCPTSSNGVYVAAYAGSYDPANPAANFLADLGVFTAPNNLASFSFQYFGGDPIVIVVSEADVGAANGCGYMLTLTGLGQAAQTAKLLGLQDDVSGDWLLINEATGDYLYTQCLTGRTLSGRGNITRQGCELTLKDGYRMNTVFQNCAFEPEEGVAHIRFNPFGNARKLCDTNRFNNTCACP